MTEEQVVYTIADAIAEFEGYFVTAAQAKKRKIAFPTRAQRNNNPGNIRPWPKCPYPSEDDYILFPDAQAGWKQLYKQIRKNVFTRHLTFLEFFAGKPGVYAGYAPAKDSNHPQKYAKFVAKAFDISDLDIKPESLVTKV